MPLNPTFYLEQKPRDYRDGLHHVVADGAEWIRLQGNTVFGDQHHMLCDFYHVSEYLVAASKIAAPARSQRWRKTQQSRLKRGASATVIAELACCYASR